MKKLLLVGLLLISAVAYSQVEQGDKNITFAGYFASADDYKVGQISAKLGYYVTQNIEAGAKPLIMFTQDDTNFGIGVYGTYNFLTQDAKLLPYAGAELFFLPVGDETLTTLGLNGGAKYFITESLNIDAGLNLQKSLSTDIYDGTVFIFQVGVGFLLGK
jgi:hypothetical protein